VLSQLPRWQLENFVAAKFYFLHAVADGNCQTWIWRKWVLVNSLSAVTVKLHKHTHPFNGPLSRTTGWAGTRKVKPIWILLKQETVSGSGISWAICKSASRSRQTTMPAPHHSVLQAGCPSCRPTNNGKALKANCETVKLHKVKQKHSLRLGL